MKTLQYPKWGGLGGRDVAPIWDATRVVCTSCGHDHVFAPNPLPPIKTPEERVAASLEALDKLPGEMLGLKCQTLLELLEKGTSNSRLSLPKLMGPFDNQNAGLTSAAGLGAGESWPFAAAQTGKRGESRCQVRQREGCQRAGVVAACGQSRAWNRMSVKILCRGMGDRWDMRLPVGRGLTC